MRFTRTQVTSVPETDQDSSAEAITIPDDPPITSVSKSSGNVENNVVTVRPFEILAGVPSSSPSSQQPTPTLAKLLPVDVIAENPFQIQSISLENVQDCSTHTYPEGTTPNLIQVGQIEQDQGEVESTSSKIKQAVTTQTDPEGTTPTLIQVGQTEQHQGEVESTSSKIKQAVTAQTDPEGSPPTFDSESVDFSSEIAAATN